MVALRSERLGFRQWRSQNRPLFADINAAPRVMESFSSILSTPQREASIGHSSDDINTFGWGFWAAESFDRPEFIGLVSINDNQGSPPFASCLDICWPLSNQHWRQGFATETAAGALEFLLMPVDLDQVMSITPVFNTASKGGIKNLRITKQMDDFVYPNVPLCDSLAEHIMYPLCRDQRLSHDFGKGQRQ
ncbi:MAG: RimJ/RimL family protein N-acetyltransferase [Arenicella sp.]|jgi:RimJ/RimL family protein N-acetyltransferase